MSTQKIHYGIGRRLRAAIDGRWESLRAFSRLTGIPYRSLLQYLREERAPGADALARIASLSGIDLHYLLLGEGSPYRASPDFDGLISRDGPRSPYGATGKRRTWSRRTKTFDASVLEEMLDAVTLMGVESVLLAARRGGLDARLRVLEALDSIHPESLSFDELARWVAKADETKLVDSKDLAADLALLVHARLVVVEEEPTNALDPTTRYRTAEPFTRVEVEHFADRCQHLLEAVRILFRYVFPHIEKADGLAKLATGTFNVPRAEARTLIGQLLDQVEQSVKNMPEDEDKIPISLVLALGAWGEDDSDTA